MIIRRLTVFATAAAVVAGCSGVDESAPPVTTEPKPIAPEPAPPAPLATVSVVDGDTGRAIPGAVVRAGAVQGRTASSGVAELSLERLGDYTVEVSAPGYTPFRERLALGETATVTLYDPRLQWPLYGANPARTQTHAGIRLRPPFRVVWERASGGLLEFPAVVWEGVAYLNNAHGGLRAISMENGRALWRRRVGSVMASSPAIDPSRREIVTTSKVPGRALVVSMDTGRVKWRYDTGASESSPVIRDEIAYLGATNGNVYALDLARRRPRWIFRGGVKITSSPALVGKRLYFGDYAGRVRALDVRSGRLLWTASAGSRVYGTTAVAGGRVFAPSVFSGLSAFSARTGRLRWRIPVSRYLYSSPAAFRGRVYFGTYAGIVYCASARSGRILWTRRVRRAVSGAVQVVGGVVYAGSFGGRITAWHWRTGRRLWTFRHGRYVPVSGNGGKLLLHSANRIYAVEPKRP